MELHPKYLVDENGKRLGVVLPEEEYRRLIEIERAAPTGSATEGLDVLQASLQLTAPAAAAWVEHARVERQSFGQHQ